MLIDSPLLSTAWHAFVHIGLHWTFRPRCATERNSI
jgi:hypothetical protein